VTTAARLLLLALVVLTACSSYQQTGSGMEPTILAGDHFTAIPLRTPPRRQQIVLLRRYGRAYVDRVVGMPGDTLSMSSGFLFVNGRQLVEPYAVHYGEDSLTNAAFLWQARFVPHVADRARYHPTLTTWGPIVVPAGQYFFLGDNRGASWDSRYTGFVAGPDIFALPQLIYFSQSRATGRIRWNRFGHVIADSV
jgi:signal peptidase I